MKTDNLSIVCGALVAAFVLLIVVLAGIVNLAISQAEKDSNKAIDYSKRVL